MAKHYEHQFGLSSAWENHLRFALSDTSDEVLAELWWWMEMRLALDAIPTEPPDFTTLPVPSVDQIIDRIKTGERSVYRQADWMLARAAAAIVTNDPAEGEFALVRQIGLRNLEPVPRWFGTTTLTAAIETFGSGRSAEWELETMTIDTRLPSEAALDDLLATDLGIDFDAIQRELAEEDDRPDA